MSAHVVVLDASARRAVIKTSPGKFLSDVLQEACTKFGLDSSQYGLKNNNKPLDLSRTIRLSGLSSGAKLELVVASRSPSVVSVALQLPEDEAKGIPNGRLTDKFPSTTTLWLVLRKFEAGVAGGFGSSRNFTARGVPRIESGSVGAGRLYYETPVLQAMGRELSSFTDLQKTLGQLGFNNGSVLFRLSFRASDSPRDEAMVQIEQYFKSVEGDDSSIADARGAHAGSIGNAQSAPETERNPGIDTGPASAASPEASSITTPKSPTAHEDTSTAIPATNNATSTPQDATPESAPPTSLTSPQTTNTTTSSNRTISVFLPPSGTTPHAAAQTYNPKDYEPTIDHAKLHQQRLSSSGRNRRLPSEAELAAQEKEAKEKLSHISSVELKVRFPDQTQVVASFSAADTAASLYAFVGNMLRNGNADGEAPSFNLTYSSPRGPKTISRDASARLIRDLGLSGRVLVTFVWDDAVAASEMARAPVLKDEFRAQAQELKVPDVVAPAVDDGAGAKGNQAQEKEKGRDTGSGSGERKIPKWLKLPGKK